MNKNKRGTGAERVERGGAGKVVLRVWGKGAWLFHRGGERRRGRSKRGRLSSAAVLEKKLLRWAEKYGIVFFVNIRVCLLLGSFS